MTKAAARKIVSILGLQVGKTIIKKGITAIDKSMQQIISWSKREYVLLLVDFDRPSRKYPCPVARINGWFQDSPCPEKLFARLAVNEVEAWLLADDDNMKKFLGVKSIKVRNADDIANPKKYLIELASKRNKFFKIGFIKRGKDGIDRGVAYNKILSEWIESEWSPCNASLHSPSLKRAIKRLQDLID